MQIELPIFLDQLCSGERIRPFRHYVIRENWKLNVENAEADFLDKKGVYCCWWSGDKEKLFAHLREFFGIEIDAGRQPQIEHGMIPMYVGMTSKAAIRKGKTLEGRIIDRFIRFPNTFSTRREHKNQRINMTISFGATCSNFQLFRFPERMHAAIENHLSVKGLTREQAERHLYDCQELVTQFADEYRDLFFDNYSISFVEMSSDIDIFYSEALAIGFLRPWLNQS